MSRCEQGGFELVVQREGGGDLGYQACWCASPVRVQDAVAYVLRLIQTYTKRELDYPNVKIV